MSTFLRGKDVPNGCLIDSRAEQSISEADQFKVVVLSGVVDQEYLDSYLEEHKQADLLPLIKHSRNMGPGPMPQMKLHTQAVVCHKVFDLGVPLASLKFVDNPSIPVDGSVMRYIDAVCHAPGFPPAGVSIEEVRQKLLVENA